jgi:hypothetical protein
MAASAVKNLEGIEVIIVISFSGVDDGQGIDRYRLQNQKGQAQRTARKDAAEDAEVAEVAIISDIGTQLPGSWSLREAL